MGSFCRRLFLGRGIGQRIHSPILVLFCKIKFEIEYPVQKNQEGGDVIQDRKRNLTGEAAYNVLKRISDEDAKILGFNTEFARPDWMCVTVLPVSPPPVRPSVMMDALRAAQDDLTHKLRDILQTNGQIKKMVTKKNFLNV